MISSIGINGGRCSDAALGRVEQQLVTQVGLFRFGLKKFEDQVNSYLHHGWYVEEINIKKGLFRYFCEALLYRVEPVKTPTKDQ